MFIGLLFFAVILFCAVAFAAVKLGESPDFKTAICETVTIGLAMSRCSNHILLISFFLGLIYIMALLVRNM